MKSLPNYSSLILRLGLAFVFIWFGLSEILNPAIWTSFIPSWMVGIGGLNAVNFVVLNGGFEILMAALLAVGFKVRIVSFLLFIHMIGIIAEVGLSPVGVRDIGIAFGLLAIFLRGTDEHCYEHPAFSA